MDKVKQDFFCGLGFLFISFIFYIQIEGEEGISAIFPLILIGLIAVGGIYYLIKSIIEYKSIALELKNTSDLNNEKEHWGNIIWVIVTSVIYAIIIPKIGYWTSTALFLGITYIGLVRRSFSLHRIILNACIFGIGFSIIVWFFFVKLMAVPTPVGIFS